MNMNRFDSPGERSFASREEARAFIRAEVASVGAHLAITDVVADELIQELQLIALSRRGPEVPPRFVVREEDLKLLEAVQAAVVAGVTVASGTASSAATALAGIFSGSALLIIKAQKKRCELSRDDVDILATLTAKPMRVDELQGTINLRRVPALQVTSERVKVALDGLLKRRCPDGTVVALVAIDANGVWSAIPHRDVTWLAGGG